MRTAALTVWACLLSFVAIGQNPSSFTCSSTDGFGYYISSGTGTFTGTSPQFLTFPASRLSRLTTSTGARTTVCASLGVSMNALAFNPRDRYLYAVSRYDASQFSGKLYRVGENCQNLEIPVTGIVKYTTNNTTTVDNGGGNIGSGTFDLDGNYYVNTSFTNAGKTGFTNKIQKIRISGNTATLLSTQTLTCASCTTTNKLQITDIIFDEASRKLYGSNKQTNQLYSINAATGAITPVGATNVTNTILGMYKNRQGVVRAVDDAGNIYGVNLSTGNFTLLTTVTDFRSGNADAASGCYTPPVISGSVFVDANGLTDSRVNGTRTQKAGASPLVANLVQSNQVVKSTALATNGTYQFLGDFQGTYEVRVGTVTGTANQVPPAQGLPTTHQFVGDFIGTDAGSDGSPNGRLSIPSITLGNSVPNVNFGIDAKPIVSNVSAAAEANPGTTVRVTVPALSRTDVEDGTPTTVRIRSVPDNAAKGILYYDNAQVTLNQDILNFDPVKFQFDPIDGDVTVVFSYAAKDRANVISNDATVTMEFTNSLPVTLVYFRGEYSGGSNSLSWQTSTEYNTDYFAVERSTGGDAFEAIGRITATGFSSELRTYTFVDATAPTPAYYRIKNVDFDGAYAYSQTIKLSSSKQSRIEVFPTVVTNGLNLRYTGGRARDLRLSLYRSGGALLMTKDLTEGQRTLDLTDLPAGLYHLVIVDRSTGKVTNKRIVKR